MASSSPSITCHSDNQCVEKKLHKRKQNHSDFLWLKKKKNLLAAIFSQSFILHSQQPPWCVPFHIFFFLYFFLKM
jgi:hypothetical protein